jgi:glycosyltransferase involved in cell wall biosynthesis
MVTHIAVVIPAHNEELYLSTTLASVKRAEAQLGELNLTTQIIVVDDGSTDDTSGIARRLGASVVATNLRNIAAARNAGAKTTDAWLIVFLDADTVIPPSALLRAWSAVGAGAAGGVIEPTYRPTRFCSRLLCIFWDFYRRVTGGGQGVFMFCARETFRALCGFDETIFMGEDTDFFRRMHSWAKEQRRALIRISDICVWPSTRRYDRWPQWKILLYQNPFVAACFVRSRRFWRGWYDETLR